MKFTGKDNKFAIIMTIPFANTLGQVNRPFINQIKSNQIKSNQITANQVFI